MTPASGKRHMRKKLPDWRAVARARFVIYCVESMPRFDRKLHKLDRSAQAAIKD